MYKQLPTVYRALHDINKNIPDNCIGIHGNVYNLDGFDHPGGAIFIQMAKGQDCTSLFETHHINIERALFYLNKQTVVGKYDCTYKSNFKNYALLRKHIKGSLNKKNIITVNVIRYLILFTVLFGHLVVCLYDLNYILIFVTSILNTVAGGVGHNAVHRFELLSLLLDWNGLSSSEWLLEHIMSHHMFTNTKHDHDAISMEPFVSWYKGTLVKTKINIFMLHCIYAVGELVVAFNGLFIHKTRWLNSDFPVKIRLLPLLFPFRYITLIISHEIYIGSIIFALQTMIASYVFSLLAHLNHATVYTIVEKTDDFLLHQLRTTNDIDVKVMNLGLDRQTMHHLFPTVDHYYLDSDLRNQIRVLIKDTKQDLVKLSVIKLYEGMKKYIHEHNRKKNNFKGSNYKPSKISVLYYIWSTYR